jgi:hypothetical protein
MIRKIGAALAIAAGALATAGIAAPANASNGDKIIDAGEVVVWKDQNFVGQLYDFGATSPTTYPSATVPSFDNCANLAGWFVNSDETSRKPDATAAGLKFEPADLIHHNVTGVTTDSLTPGTYVASPAPGQPSFFSVEVDSGTAGTYGTLRWNPTTSQWSMVVSGVEYDNASATAVVDHFGKSHTVVRFGVGFTQNPPGTVTTVVSSVTFNGTTFPLTCDLPAFGTSPGTLTPIDDNTSSIANYSSSYVQAFVDGNYTGAHIQLLPYLSPTSGGLSYAYSSLGTLDNKLSSHKVAGP